MKSNYNKQKLLCQLVLGQPADIDAIQDIADKYNIKVIIDGAQSFGSTYNAKMDSNLGDISTTSFFPQNHLGVMAMEGLFLQIINITQIKLNN